jgi:hypothetical protein
LMACWLRSRWSGGCARPRPGLAREVRGARRRWRVPLSRGAPASVPSWEAFPEVNRAVVGRLLGQLVERMVRSAAASGRGGGECGEVAVGAVGGQGSGLAS